MRQCLVLLFMLAFATSVHAGEKKAEAPKPVTEKAAFSATRNFIRALASTPAADRSDLLDRYVDVATMEMNLVGAKDLKPLDRASRTRLRTLLRELLAKSLATALPVPEDPATAVLTSESAPASARKITYTAGEDKGFFVWTPARQGLLLTSFGKGGGLGTMSVLGTYRAESGQAPLAFVEMLAKRMRDMKPVGVVKSIDNIRSMITLMIARRIGMRVGGYPPYSGKAFILSLVATGDLDRRNASNLEILFSPGDKTLSLAKEGAEIYKDVTKASLKQGMDCSKLTSYAGRRNSEREYLVTSDQEKVGTALIADLSFPDMAIVGFSDGSVKTMTRKELGLGPDDPIVAGDASNSDLLKKLSSQ